MNRAISVAIISSKRSLITRHYSNNTTNMIFSRNIILAAAAAVYGASSTSAFAPSTGECTHIRSIAVQEILCGIAIDVIVRRNKYGELRAKVMTDNVVIVTIMQWQRGHGFIWREMGEILLLCQYKIPTHVQSPSHMLSCLNLSQ